MDVIGFFSDMIIFTAGLVVLMFWMVVIIAVAIEIYDALTSRGASDDTDMEEFR